MGAQQLRQSQGLVHLVDGFGSATKELTGLELRRLTDVFRGRLAAGEALGDLLPEAFAAVREAARRVWGFGYVDAQLIAGAALQPGRLVEIKDGEGKSFIAILSAYLYALLGDAVHVVTLSEHPARRDAKHAGAVLGVLGLNVGLIAASSSPPQRKEAYAADVTYGDYSQFVYDYLRDHLVQEPGARVQRGNHVSFVDEADSILISHAPALMTIGAPQHADSALYRSCVEIAERLERNVHYEVVGAGLEVAPTADGINYIADAFNLSIEDFSDVRNLPLIRHLEGAILAKESYRRGEHYLVVDGSVAVVAEPRGYQDSRGVQQALEAKEGLKITDEHRPLAAITVRDYFRRYDRLAGMTATATVSAAEFEHVYGLHVVEVPPHKPVIRDDHDDVIYSSDQARLPALTREVAARHATGQPVVVGTRTTEAGNRIRSALEDQGITCSIVATGPDIHDQAELAGMAQAGRLGRVTIMCGMAGRGLDIPLGGDADDLAVQKLLGEGVDPAEMAPGSWENALQATRAGIVPTVLAERARVLDAGGLAVLSIERGWSRRADDWRRGLAGRRGEPGVSKFFLSMEDELLWEFAGEVSIVTGSRFPVLADMPRDGPAATQLLAEIEREVEARRIARISEELPFRDVVDQQRTQVYTWRRAILEGRDLRRRTRQMTAEVIERCVTASVQLPIDQADLNRLRSRLGPIYPTNLSAGRLAKESGRQLRDVSVPLLIEQLRARAHAAHTRRERKLGRRNMRKLERRAMLSAIDRHWSEHLRQMDLAYDYFDLVADDSDGLLANYRLKTERLFNAMLENIKRDAIHYLYDTAT